MPSSLMSGQEILEGDAIIPHICKQLWEFDAALPEAVDSRKEHDSGVWPSAIVPGEVEDQGEEVIGPRW